MPVSQEESRAAGPAASEAQKEYFRRLKAEVEHCYQIAQEARTRGLDPEEDVEIPMAEDLAARVERLVGPLEVAPVIREYSRKYANREEVALRVAEKIARDMGMSSREGALDQAVRTGLAILTEGVLVAPLEGIAEIKVRSHGGAEYVDLYFAGPIRSAGGTGQALSVLIADVVRRALSIGPFQATPREVERYKEEIPKYKQIQHLQYTPSPEEIHIVATGCPVCINGEGTEDEEVSGHRDLERVDTNRIRGGACLVMAEGLCLKASKVQKHVKNLGIEGWEFIDEYLAHTKGAGVGGGGTGGGVAKARGDGAGGDEGAGASGARGPGGLGELDAGDDEPDEELEAELEEMHALESFGPPASEKYIREIIAGRPVFSHPSRPGGFRLRYGRARTAGLASLAIHPAAMFLVDNFLAIGTQMKIERPGKATVSTPCDMLDPPLVLMKDGTFRETGDPGEFPALLADVEKIIDLGEILIPYGEFVENNHALVQGAFSPEWWELEARDRLGPTAMDVFERCRGDEPAASVAASLFHGVPLHPRWNLFWHDISQVSYNRLREEMLKGGRLSFNPEAPAGGRHRLTIPFSEFVKGALLDLGVLHRPGEGRAQVVERYAVPLCACLGLGPETGEGDISGEEGWAAMWQVEGEVTLAKLALPPGIGAGDASEPAPTHEPEGGAAAFPRDDRFRMTLGLLRSRSGLIVYPRGPVRIGTRMGRPEKAKERKMNPMVHVLFPLSKKGGPQRLVKKAAAEKRITVEMGSRVCISCGTRGFAYRCPTEGCGSHTKAPEEPRVVEQDISVGDLLDRARETLGIAPGAVPDMKGVQGLISKGKTPEPLEKGILRARYGVSIFKDGTIRYDMTDVPLTHFRPREIGTSVERLRELGYTHDIAGQPLTGDGQMLELRVQDIVAARGFGEYMVGTAKFVDEMLRSFYGLQPFYNVEEPGDLVGHLVIGLAPHTSGGVLGRLIGYTSAAVCLAHPYFHAAKRRNCDGDEDCLMLLLEGLLDFSRSYLPSSRGGQMDAPLVLSTRLDPDEIDKEAHNLDTSWSYPLELYRAAQAGAQPKDVEKYMETVGKRIGTPGQYEGLGYTHDTADINLGPRVSAYKSLGTMVEKMKAQLALAGKLRAVDESDVANKILTSHFLPDMQGNLRSFTKQGARCTKCNAKYRRIPLRGEGKCVKIGRNEKTACGGNLVLTVHEGGVVKYLEISKEMMEEYDIPLYTRQRVLLQEESIRSTFRNDKVKTPKLSDFL